MKATIRPFYTEEGSYLVAVEFDVDPSEIEDVAEATVNAAAQWASGMARSLWLQSSRDIDTMAWIDTARVPDSPPDGLTPPTDEGDE